MSTAASVVPSPWRTAPVVEVRDETARAKTFRIALDPPQPFLAGQHYLVRLTAPDGYTATRSYSVASSPLDPSNIELTVELLPGGEVSGFLHDEVVVGDELEVRGPIGGYFVWEDGPALLVGGGSGIVPLMSMLRLARSTGPAGPVHLVASARSPDDLLYAAELVGPDVTLAFTRAGPAGGRALGRLRQDDLAPVPADATAYVCGTSGFADHVTDLLQGLGVTPDRIRVERFGPTH